MNNVIIVGVGEVTEQVPEDLALASSPLDLMARAVILALTETGCKAIGSAVDTIAAVRTFSESGAQLKSPFGDPINLPRSICERTGLNPKNAVLSCSGGQVPQQLVNEFAEKIATGERDVVLLFGGEALANQKALKKAKVKANWRDDADGPVERRHPEITNMFDIGNLQNEFLHIPSAYTVMENARRKKLGLSREDYAKQCGKLFEDLSKVSATHPNSMFPQGLQSADIIKVTDANNSITETYPRAMTAKDGVNQAAAVLMMNPEKAKELGIDESLWIYAISGSEAEDVTLPYREDLSQSVAMKAAYDGALSAAGLSSGDMSCFDIYSCFPVAVFAACDALGIAYDDPRGLTVTGGLPFFGGPGNNYSMHGIVNVVKNLRASGEGYGLVGANGGFITKHCIGVYGSQPPNDGWNMADTSALKAKVDAQSQPNVAYFADGRAKIQGYSVEYGRKGPKRAYVIGQLEDGRNFIGSTDREDMVTVQAILADDPINRHIYVTSKGPGNRFTFDQDSTRKLMPPMASSLDEKFEFCRVQRSGRILEVTINRPESRNSLTPEANFELEQIFNLYEKDRSLWVAILTGAGEKSFSAGNDLKYMGTGKPIWFPETGFAGLTHRKKRLKPVIAAVNGYAFGGGLEIALACDIIVADETAKFALPEVKTGLIAAAGGVFRLPKVLPPHIAKDMILTGRTMEVEEALRYGMVNYRADAGQAVQKAREIAERVCTASPTAVSASLEMMYEGKDIIDPSEALDRSTNALQKVAASEDLQIGLMAFLTKQAAKWKNR